MQLFKSLFGTHHERSIKKFAPLVQKIGSFEASLQKLRDADLQAKSAEFKTRLDRGEPLDSLLPEAFAVCREASVRVLGMRHYDVQMIGGIVLSQGSIAEMRTGEGKTLVATLPTYLNALTGKGSHLVTVNDYLATRDAEWMGQLYNWLGLSIGTIVHDLSDEERQKSYNSDIVYGTNNEFGFDYLRDNMKFDQKQFVQRELNFAIVDECDSILIDEARTPLIISGPSEDSIDKYYDINKVIPHLKLDLDFTMEEKSKTVSLTEEGNSKVEKLLGVDNVYDISTIGLLHHIYQGLKAYHLFHKDKDYMIVNNEIVIVDEFTGRLMSGRRWSDGLHQAVEAKEGVPVRSENQTLATITFQNFFRMYNKLSGMTGTAETESLEFKKIYDLDVLVIPTNKPIARIDQNDLIYKNNPQKYKAIAKDIKERHANGQPVLVGTVSIERSEAISDALKEEKIPHNVLNAKHHEREAEIVSQAGRKGAITIATNMAGRGTDIMLGGNPEALAKNDVPDTDSPDYEKTLNMYTRQTQSEKEEVKNAGGLYIIGTERHEARRVDNQLRGRSGRQGDPGESRFYLSLEDDLMRIFGGERMQNIMTTLKVPEDEPIEHRMVSRAIEKSQKKVEAQNFDIRKHLLEYDDVMNKQRNIVYSLRREVFKSESLDQPYKELLGDLSTEILDLYVPEDAKRDKWDLEGLSTALNKQFGFTLPGEEADVWSDHQINDFVEKNVKERYENQEKHLADLKDEVMKMIYLQTIDIQWKDHLKSVDHLKEGINLRAYAQKDPVIEYKKEAFKAFEEMLYQIKAETIEKYLKVSIVKPDEMQRWEQAQQQKSKLNYQGAEESQNMSAMAPPPEASGGGSQRDESLNRSQRRSYEKKKKKKLKI